MIERLRALLLDDSGAVLAEYTVIASAFVITGFVAIKLVSDAASTVLGNTAKDLANLAACPPGSIGC